MKRQLCSQDPEEDVDGVYMIVCSTTLFPVGSSGALTSANIREPLHRVLTNFGL